MRNVKLVYGEVQSQAGCCSSCNPVQANNATFRSRTETKTTKYSKLEAAYYKYWANCDVAYEGGYYVLYCDNNCSFSQSPQYCYGSYGGYASYYSGSCRTVKSLSYIY